VVCVHEHFVSGVETQRLTGGTTVWRFDERGAGGLPLAAGFRFELGCVSRAAQGVVVMM